MYRNTILDYFNQILSSGAFILENFITTLLETLAEFFSVLSSIFVQSQSPGKVSSLTDVSLEIMSSAEGRIVSKEELKMTEFEWSGFYVYLALPLLMFLRLILDSKKMKERTIPAIISIMSC